jgi:hypothetical protein
MADRRCEDECAGAEGRHNRRHGAAAQRAKPQALAVQTQATVREAQDRQDTSARVSRQGGPWRQPVGGKAIGAVSPHERAR